MDGDFFGDVGSFFGGIGSDIGNLFTGGTSAPSGVTAPPPTLPDASTFGGTPTTTSFDFTNSFGFNPISTPTAPAASTGIYQPNTLGGVAAPDFSTGQSSPFSLATSATSDPLAQLFTQGTPANQQVGPTNFAATSTPGATPPAPAAGGGTDNSLLSLLGIGTGTSKLDQQLLGGGVAGAGLLYNLLSGSPSVSAEKSLKNIAGQQSAQAQTLESYLNNGTLPPGAQQWVNQQTAAQQAAIRAKYAQLGMSGSTAETQELNNVQAQATAQMFTITSQLLQTGVQESGASANLYQALMNAQNQDAQQVSSAIQNFVSALGGGGSPGTVSLKLAS